MIVINRSDLIGKGTHREVYRHPQQSNLCIKIVVDGSEESRQEQREKSYYKRLKKQGISWDMIPEYHGAIATDLGPGFVFDLISDDDGNVSKSLEHYVASNDITEPFSESLKTQLYLLKDYLMKNHIVTKTLSPRNIACQRDHSEIVRLYIIDNIGNLDPFPISNYIKPLAAFKIYRRWKRFEQKLLEAHPDNKALHRILCE